MAIVDPRFTKTVSSSLMVQAERIDNVIVANDELLWTSCLRTATTNNRGNYFVSFQLPAYSNLLSTASTISNFFPELYQLNTDYIIFCSIPNTAYTEFIDARSIKLTVPTTGGTTILYSSTYASDKPLKYGETSPLLGDNITYLFSDQINTPYTGFTATEIGIKTSMSSNTTWNPNVSEYWDRPSAVSYREVLGGGISSALNPNNRPNGLNTDKRLASGITWSILPPTNYPDGVAGYNYDIPVGFCILDKGICVITHTAVTNSFDWASSVQNPSSQDDEVNITFNSNSQIEFTDINTSFKTTAVCLALPQEFWISNNPTWNRSAALNNLNSQTGILTINPVYVTEIGLYNQMNELVAVGKLSDYVEKNYINLITFNLDIDM